MAAGKSQFDLFGAPRTPASPGPVDAADVPPDVAALAGRLQPSIRFGTSSWAFPGWVELVYAESASTSVLSRDGLAAYAQHPLLRAVGLDRTYYSPLPRSEFARMAECVPPDFRFLIKAHAALTSPAGSASARSFGGGRDDLFLNAEYASNEVIGPAVDGLGETLGVVLLQFSPLAARSRALTSLPERLATFLAALPRGPRYAVEIRNASLLTSDYVDALVAGHACHCATVHPSMPDVRTQADQLGSRAFPDGVIPLRWMLRGDQQYEAARDAYAPFHVLADPDPTSRVDVASLIERLMGPNREILIIANNKAEGSAPRTLIELARLLVARGAVTR